ncbi:MAG TPA: ROK family protein [Anaerolineales bacterium]|nr:ROK family protein [Anaerolineales bacterium]
MQPDCLPRRIIGIDVGGTKICAALVDLEGRIHWSSRHPTDTSNPEATLDSIAAAAHELVAANHLDPAQLDGIGFGIPGLVDAAAGMGVASVNLGWQDVAVRAGLEARLGVRCAIENDVRAGALGEAYFGGARGLRNLVYLNIGTGISAVILIDGRFFLGVRGLAGEIGHAVMDPDGALCKCGGHGCFEALASGPGIVERAVAKIRRGQESVLAPSDGMGYPPVTTERIFAAAAQRDRVAVETLEEAGRLIAYALEYLALAYDPQAIVVGGGIVLNSPVLYKTIRLSLEDLAGKSWVFGRAYTADLVRLSTLGNNAGVLGAAALVVYPQGGQSSPLYGGIREGGHGHDTQ